MSTKKHTDQQIQRAIVTQFDWSPDIRSEHVGVAVTDGAVTLSGEAANHSEKNAALAAATDVAGVVAIVDEIEVREPDQTNEADIGRAVNEVILTHPLSAGHTITAAVHDDVVTLHGTVEEPEHRFAVEKVVSAVTGVRGVVNELRVLPRPSRADTKQLIAEALMRGVESEIEHLVIEVDGHRARLQGTVHSYYERRVAERAARSVPGVTEVDNCLAVAF